MSHRLAADLSMILQFVDMFGQRVDSNDTDSISTPPKFDL
jgi:hypothetical protein